MHNGLPLKVSEPTSQVCPPVYICRASVILYRRAEYTRITHTCEMQQPEPRGCKGLALAHCLPLAFQGSLCPGDMAGTFPGPRKARVGVTHRRLCSSPALCLLPQVSWSLQGPQFLRLHSETCTDVPLRSQTSQSVTAEPALCWLWLHCPLS